VHLADVVSSDDVLVALEPDELGLRILQVLAAWSPQLIQLQLGSFLTGALQGFPTSRRQDEIKQAIQEAWYWLEGQALLIPDPRYRGRDMLVLSRKARRLVKDQNARRAIVGHRLPKETLHPSIKEDVWALYQRGKYDTAVLEAMKAVEVAVRDAAKLGADKIGRHLMRTAFAIEDGLLTNKTAERSEREAMADLFSGAIGAYKNPHSHRRISLDDPDEVAEIILLANHLLRIVDARRQPANISP
jgi:uncharacterized protein (TIGR02391 family)